MGKPVIVTSSDDIVAQGTTAWLNSICFHSETENSSNKVRILDGGSSGTAVFEIVITDGSDEGDRNFSHTWGAAQNGARMEDGLYVEITGTLSVNLEYTSG